MGGGRCLVKQNGPQTSLEGNHDKHVSGTHQAPSQWRPQWKKAQILSKKNISEDSSGNGIDILKSKTERIIQEISTIINLSSEKYKGGSFWSHIKHTRSDKSGFSSLMPGCDKVTDLTTKAKLLNDQFQRAFYKIVPMKLKHTAEQATNAQVSGDCYARMSPINITVEGVQKLLDKLNPYKAPGPGTYSPEARLLQSLATYSRFSLK